MDTLTLDSKTATKQRLIEAAETLFADQGFEKVSVRDITSMADANVAAINYHFGSREGLLDLIVARWTNPINEERLNRLDELERDAAGKPVPLEDIIYAFMVPFCTRVRSSEISEKLFFKLAGRMFSEQCKFPPTVEALFYRVAARFHAAFSKALPQFSAEEIWWRFHFTAGSMVHIFANAHKLHMLSNGACGEPELEVIVERFVKYAASGMRNEA